MQTTYVSAVASGFKADPLKHPRAEIAQTLIHDVLLTIFARFSLPELVVLSAVCRHWRAVARAHPTYWRTVSLTKPADGAVDFFLTHISTSVTALLRLTVKTQVVSDARLISKILDAIRENLGRIKSLDLDLDSFPMSNHQAVMCALSNPAPSLQHLALRSSTPEVVLSRTLFAFDLPQLRSLTLVGVDMPNSCPSAFESVADLIYSNTTPPEDSGFPETLYRYRSLAMLVLETCTFPSQFISALSSLGTLSTLHLEFFETDMLSSLDTLQHLHTISVSKLSESAAMNDAFFGHLEGDLVLILPDAGWKENFGTVSIELVELSATQRVRFVTEEPIAALIYEPRHPVDRIVERIVIAQLPIRLLYPLGQWFQNTAASLRRMRVVVDSRDRRPFDALLRCPALKRLEVAGDSDDDDDGPALISENDLLYLQIMVLDVQDKFGSDEFDVRLENIYIGGENRLPDDDRHDDEYLCGHSFATPYYMCEGDGCYDCTGTLLADI